MKLSNSIFDDLNNSSLLFISLMGVRTLLERELELKDLILASEDAASRELKRRLTSNVDNSISYPYSYLSLSELSAVRDQNPNKNVKRFGYRTGASNATKATSRKAYIFPVHVQLSLHYLDNDPTRTLRMAEALVILCQIGAMVFSMKSEALDVEVFVEIPETATIPVSESENTHAPGAQEIEVPFIIHTWAGFFRDVSAVNSDKPIISCSFKDSYLQHII